MKHTLVGYTGFVGRNLAAEHSFDAMYNSANIAESFGAENGLVVYSGMYSEKFLANADPAADLARARQAFENIQKMRPERLVLISTVDVYPLPIRVFEDSPAGGEGAPAYGANRLALEAWVRESYPEALVVRLPGLFGLGLKKNFLFDMFTLTPMMLKEDKYKELCNKEPLVKKCYRRDDLGFYRLAAEEGQKAALRAFFKENDFNALSFTDSRSVFQFYNLQNLWRDLDLCLQKGLRLINLATPPVAAGHVYEVLFGKPFENYLDKPPVCYDMRTRYGRELGGGDDYIADRAEVLADIGKLAGRMLAEENAPADTKKGGSQ